MLGFGFIPTYSRPATNDVAFEIDGVPMVTSYIFVGTGGNIVWKNNKGDAQYFPNAQSNTIYWLGATEILSSAVVDGVNRTTSASNIVWFGLGRLNNTP